jgi:hypothetical protein
MEKFRVFFKVVSLCLAILLGLAVAGQADTYFEGSSLTDDSLFGHLSQGTGAIRTAYGTNGCPPTAVVNAFVYLQKKFPSVYGMSLVPGYDTASMASVAVALGNPAYMNGITTTDAGKVSTTFWSYGDTVWGPNLYIESKMPGKTVYGVQKVPTNASEVHGPNPSWCSAATNYPQISFLIDALEKSQALFITWNQVNPDTGIINWSGAGHYLTVTGLVWDPAAMAGTLYYIDTSYGSFHNSPIWYDQEKGTQALWIDYGEDGTNVWQNPPPGSGNWWFHGDAQITLAYAMGPVATPLPSTLLLLGSGLLGLAGLGRRLRKS